MNEQALNQGMTQLLPAHSQIRRKDNGMHGDLRAPPFRFLACLVQHLMLGKTCRHSLSHMMFIYHGKSWVPGLRDSIYLGEEYEGPSFECSWDGTVKGLYIYMSTYKPGSIKASGCLPDIASNVVWLWSGSGLALGSDLG